MAMKKKMTEKSMEMCNDYYCHPHKQGKALLSLGIGLVLVTFGLGYIGLPLLAQLLGVAFILKGAIKFMGC